MTPICLAPSTVVTTISSIMVQQIWLKQWFPVKRQKFLDQTTAVRSPSSCQSTSLNSEFHSSRISSIVKITSIPRLHLHNQTPGLAPNNLTSNRIKAHMLTLRIQQVCKVKSCTNSCLPITKGTQIRVPTLNYTSRNSFLHEMEGQLRLEVCFRIYIIFVYHKQISKI